MVSNITYDVDKLHIRVMSFSNYPIAHEVYAVINDGYIDELCLPE